MERFLVRKKNTVNMKKDWKAQEKNGNKYDRVYATYKEFCRIMDEYRDGYGFIEPLSYPDVDTFMSNLKCPRFLGVAEK